MIVCKRLTGFTPGADYMELDTDAGKLRLYFLRDDIIRIRCTFTPEFAEDASYALITTAWEDRLDGLFQSERRRIRPVTPEIVREETALVFQTKALRVVVQQEPFGIDIFDRDGCRLYSDLRERSYVKDALGRLYHYQLLDPDDCYYGFGEKSGRLNKAKRRLRMANNDTLGYDSETADPLYKMIPFYLKLNRKQPVATGLFYHNFHPAVFDLGCERCAYVPRYSYYCADGGELDLFFIYGPALADVIRGYTDLTGKTALPPRYSLGYMGSTMYYTELDQDSDAAVLGFVAKARKHEIPLDGFHLSSGYTSGSDGKRYVFNWNRRRFPDPARFIKQMQVQGATVSPNVKPGLLTTHPRYRQFQAVDGLIKEAAGDRPHLTRFWGGPGSLVDFTQPAARDLWKRLLRENLVDYGIKAIWNDNCEFELDDPDALCHNDGQPVAASAVKAILPNLMALVARQAIAEAAPEQRPYILNRAGGPGIQRYAQTWAGDNYTSWHSLRFNIPVMLGMGLSGVANQGIDVGGFAGPAPEPELLVRWVQNAVFYPRFCIHSMNDDNTVTEPWMYPSVTGLIRDALKLRYRLLPYLYSLFHEAARTGAPVMRPLVYEFQHDSNTYETSFDFLCGPWLLVAGVFEKGQTEREVYLPAGAQWQDWHSGARYAGGQTVTVATPLERLPFFLRSGAILPLGEPGPSIQLQTETELKLLIYPEGQSRFVLYEDDGVSNDYLTGRFLSTAITVLADSRQVTVAFAPEGDYRSPLTRVCLDVCCERTAPVGVTVAGEPLPLLLDAEAWQAAECGWHFNQELRRAQIKYPRRDGSYAVAINCWNPDLIE